MATEVTIKLDQVTLQTVKMGLAALQLQAQAADALLTAQVQAAIDAAQASGSPPTDEANPNNRSPYTNGHATEGASV